MIKMQDVHWIRSVFFTATQQDLFEFSRGAKNISSMDPEWLGTLSVEKRQRMEKLGQWDQCSDLLKSLLTFRLECLLEIPRESKLEWVNSGKGKLSEWFHWTEANRLYMSSILEVKTHSVMIRREVMTYRSGSLGQVTATGVVAFDQFPVVIPYLEMFFGMKWNKETPEVWEAQLRIRWLEWYQTIHGYSYFATEKEKYAFSRIRNEWQFEDQVNAHMRIISGMSNSFSCKAYLKRFTSFDFVTERILLWTAYAKSVKSENFVQFIFLSTLWARSVQDLRRQTYQEVGNFVLGTVHVRDAKMDDRLGIGERLQDQEGTSLIVLRPIELWDWKSTQNVPVDIACCMYFTVRVSDIENIILRMMFEPSMKMKAEDEFTCSLFKERDYVAKFDPKEYDLSRFGTMGERFIVSALRREIQRVGTISPLMIYTVISENPIKRFVLSFGVPTWTVVVSDQPVKSITVVDERTFTFSVDEVRDNLWIILETDQGFGISSLGSFPEQPLLVTDVCDGDYFHSPDGKWSMQVRGHGLRGYGVWVCKAPGQRRRMLTLHPSRWIEDHGIPFFEGKWLPNKKKEERVFGQVLPMMVRPFGGNYCCPLQHVRADFNFGTFPDNKMEAWDHRLDY